MRIGRGAFTGVVEKTSDPARGGEIVARTRRFPDFRRAEMASIRVRITDVLDYRQFSSIEKTVHRGAGRMQPVRITRAENLVFRNSEGRPQPVIISVLE